MKKQDLIQTLQKSQFEVKQTFKGNKLQIKKEVEKLHTNSETYYFLILKSREIKGL